MSKQIAIVIPARFNSTRFPGKPLAHIGNKTMLEHTCATALKAADLLGNTQVLVATDDQRIVDHAQQITGISTTLTPDTCPTGSDRVLAAIDALSLTPDIIINLQGDAPFTPAHFLQHIANALIAQPKTDVATPVVQLNWKELDILRHNKKTTPFSGTTVIINAQQQAIWFSKNIVPAIRKEESLRQQSSLSPVYQHIGLYGFQAAALRQFVALPESHYEKLEGLEQLRLLENNFSIHAAVVDYAQHSPLSGVDTPQDLERVTQAAKQQGLI